MGIYFTGDNMCKKVGVLRFAVCNFICAMLIIFSFFNVFEKTKGIETKPKENSFFWPDGDFYSSKENVTSEAQKTQEAQKEQTLSTNTSSTPVSADAVKGKIVERYISPYKAPQSYNNVYMKNSTGVNVDIKALLNSPLKYKIEKNEQPQVLIVHTHATETFMKEDVDYYTEDFNARTTNNKENMVQIGNLVSKKINEKGIKTLHDTTKHDYPEYSGSYGRSAKTVNSYLKKYPSIKIVIDLHRDSVSAGGSDKAKLVTKINGKKAAQVMIVMGSETGSIKDHPNWKENLKLGLKLQQTIETKYPTLARPLSLMSKRYNQSLSSGALLIEIGTEANTLEEASYSAELVAEALVELLNKLD